jgi:thioredoxin reductase (NADPH)
LLDCLVIGGGAAGLVAAVYLGRYRRQVAVIDDGGSRLSMIPKTRNVLGFPDGIAGPQLLENMQRHAARYGAPVERGRIERLVRREDGAFDAWAGTRLLSARFVLLATGARDVEPAVAGLQPALQGGQVRYCPVCDGFETQGQRVAVLGPQTHGLKEAMFLRHFGNHVTWLSMGTRHAVPAGELERLGAAGIEVADSPPADIRCVPGQGVAVELEGGKVLAFHTLYPALGLAHASQLATALGARAQPDGQLEVDDHFETSVPGLYAAGDVAAGLNQINVAAGQASIAATAIHNRL